MVLSSGQRQTLEAVCETIIPGAGEGLPAQILHVLSTSGNPADLAQFRQALTLLGLPMVGLLLHGEGRPFAGLDRPRREEVLRRWAMHPVPVLRQAFQAFKRLAGFLYCSAPGSPVWAPLGYPGQDGRPPASPALQVGRVVDEQELEADAVIVGSGAG
ncbi:MAG TPA: gluconate 2-dehydrogenase subunit 3 family protein, partial [Candidatus Sulfotelmatobacter sp.]|nr:gluconate 2-dehydrogenase subunit 3 family protein [Candidatus Sulfotelmatobacter sp.]